ncbi:hypothetical protein MKEN_00232800 [Mycena kentingensis (nom. inval.)]|nr:hypothetical protein MKEN_00232800 [Mycena kentingensis (nom. inval.)]
MDATPPEETLTMLQQYASFPFSDDDEYQSGLATLIADGVFANDPPEDVRAEILRKTRVFYFNRVTGQELSVDDVRVYEEPRPPHSIELPAAAAGETTEAANPDAADADPPVLTFAQLKALIEAGKEDEIPNNKVIPEGLNEAPPSVSAAPARRKPWEDAMSMEGA